MSAEKEHSENGGAVATSSARLVDLYTEMVRIRAFEEACQKGFRQGKIGGYLHVYIGRLRRKLEDDPERPKYIRTEPGIGYRLLA